VLAAVKARAPHAQVEIHNVLDSAGRFFKKLYGGGYVNLIRYFPTGMGWLYDYTDRPAGGFDDRLRVAAQNLFVARTARYIVSRAPQLIINTHFLAAEIVSELRRTRRLDCPQTTVTTDFETHRMWVNEPTERYFTATDLGRFYLTTWGPAPERVFTTGIPVRPGFLKPLGKEEARAMLGLHQKLPCVLLLGGARGINAPDTLLRQLIEMDAEAQIAVVGGRDEALRQRLQRLAASARRPVRVLPYTDRIYEWMYAADLAVGKPGGLTVAEVLVCGLPLVIISPIPGQETRNSDYLLENWAAIKVSHPRLLGYRVSQLLNDPVALQRLQDSSRRLGRPHAADDIARLSLDLIT
ncbi:MAG TPA: glycosyltransferase, partial [Phycisphaerae bacterium]|nr:glycosyltransferase [Phycisphaerae bacterium]